MQTCVFADSCNKGSMRVAWYVRRYYTNTMTQ